MKYILVVFTVVLLAANESYAQQSRNITLAEAVDLGLKNSKQLKLNGAKIKEAMALIKQAADRKLPDAGFSGSYLFLPLHPVVDLKTGSGNNNPPAVNQVLYGTVSVSLPVYTGGRIDYGIEAARIMAEAVKSDSANDRQGVAMSLVSAAVNIFKTHSAIELVRENLQLSEQRVKDFSNLEKNGLLARNDLMKAEYQSSGTELALLDAETNYKLACTNLNIMTGLPEETVLIPDRSGLALPATIKTIREYEQDALQKRNDIAALGYRGKSALLGVKIAKAGRFPEVALTGGYIAADIPKFLSVYNAINIGLGIKYNLGGLWKNKALVDQATAKWLQVNVTEEILSDNIRMQINQVYQAYLLSTKKIEVYLKAVDQATENYRVTKNKFDNNLATATELLDADVALLQSRLGVTNAKADSFLAYNRLLQAAGTLSY